MLNILKVSTQCNSLPSQHTRLAPTGVPSGAPSGTRMVYPSGSREILATGPVRYPGGLSRRAVPNGARKNPFRANPLGGPVRAP